MSPRETVAQVLIAHSYDYDEGACWCGHRAGNLANHVAAEVISALVENGATF